MSEDPKTLALVADLAKQLGAAEADRDAWREQCLRLEAGLPPPAPQALTAPAEPPMSPTTAAGILLTEVFRAMGTDHRNRRTLLGFAPDLLH